MPVLETLMQVSQLFPGVTCNYMLEGFTTLQNKRRFYIGASKNMNKRLLQHWTGKTSFGRLTGGNLLVVYWEHVKGGYGKALSQEKVYKKLNVKERVETRDRWRANSNYVIILPERLKKKTKRKRRSGVKIDFKRNRS